MKTLSIVIVNWNSRHQLKNCLESINNSDKNNFILNEIIIVDNNSSDNSIKDIEHIALQVKIIKNDTNLGFGKACNMGTKNSKSDFILFLNPDAMVYEDTFEKLFDYINKSDTKDIGVYGVQLVGDDGKVQRNCAKLPSLSSFISRSLGLNKLNPRLFPSYTMEAWDHLDTREVDQVMGAFFMIKREIFEELDGFDERFFVYYEELDLSKRVKDKGCKTLFVSEAKAYHKGGGTSEQVKAKRLFYNTRSRLIYGLKHFGLLQGMFLLLFTFIVEPITRTLFLVLKGKYSEILENLKGFGVLYIDSLNIIKLGMRK